MSAKIDKSRISSTTTMFIPSASSGEHFPDNSGSRTTENCAEHFQSWNSRVSFPPENRLSSESLVCRTMRLERSGECENVYKNKSSHQKINNRLSSSSSSNISSDTTSNMLEKSIGHLARLFVKSSSSSVSETDHCSHYNSKFICPSTQKSSKKLPSSTAHSTMSHNHHHWSSQFGIVLVAILLFSSSTVMCVPIGNEVQQRGNEDEGSSSKLVEYSRKLNSPQDGEPVSISQANGQPMYLPDSLYKNGGIVADEMVTMKNNNLYHTSIPTPSNYHKFLKKSSIQKPPHHKDISRSIHLNDDPDDDSDEMDNEVSPPSQFGRATQNDDPIVSGSPNDEDDDNVGAMDQSPSSSDSGQWETVIDPHLYLLTEWGNPNAAGNRKYMETEQQPTRQLLQKQGQFSIFRPQRKRRNSGTGPSLSIVNPLDVLRQRLLLEIARRRMRQSHNQIIANEEILRKIGRR